MNPKFCLSGNTTDQHKPISKPITPTQLLELSIKQKEQIKLYFPETVKTYPLPINYII